MSIPLTYKYYCFWLFIISDCSWAWLGGVSPRCLQPAAINEFFALENWEFGETFYFTELSTYVMQQLTPNVVTFVIVPNQVSSTFGSLFEIKSESDEIFISSATVADVELIDNVTATRLRSSGSIVTNATTTNTGLTSSGLSTTGGAN